eukprot:scaffold404995_cov15-Prasinocladus_malaysianus.AAC.1
MAATKAAEVWQNVYVSAACNAETELDLQRDSFVSTYHHRQLGTLAIVRFFQHIARLRPYEWQNDHHNTTKN